MSTRNLTEWNMGLDRNESKVWKIYSVKITYCEWKLRWILKQGPSSYHLLVINYKLKLSWKFFKFFLIYRISFSGNLESWEFWGINFNSWRNIKFVKVYWFHILLESAKKKNRGSHLKFQSPHPSFNNIG